jgi:membrane protease YdiL (CAAX protease family)
LPDTRLTGSEKRTLILWIIFGIFGAFFAQRNYLRAFPEASVDFKVSRAEAQKRAAEFLQGQGENVTGYQSTITFDVDENAKTYLERELGLQQANQLMSSELNIWYWDVRFFRPLQEEEFEVRVNPAGKVVAFDHKIPEARASSSLDREQALAAAEQFLQNKLGTELSNWNFLTEEANSTTRPNRLDWSFTWERKDFKAKDAPYRLVVGLEGDRIGDSQQFLQVPEVWARDFRRLRSTNEFYGQFAIIPYGFLIGGALWLGISLTRRGQANWRAALIVAAISTSVFILMRLNEWNSIRAGYNTHDSYGSFLTQSIAGLIVIALLNCALPILCALPGGEPLYREAQPERLRLYKAFTLRGIRSKEFFSASVVGLSLAAAHIGFVVAFYMVGSKLGVWAPQDVNYSDVVNTAFPWIAGLAIGIVAATTEEFVFRLFAIPFLHKLTGSRVLSVILPAFFWSFLHSTYPQEPGYIRGIEVGAIGIVAGIVMLRWGIVSTLIWHYTVDASLVGLLLIRSDNLYFKISGVIVGFAAVAPLAFSGLSYLFRGTFESVEDLLNSAEPLEKIDLSAQPSATDEQRTSSRRYHPLTSGMIGFLILSVLVGGLLAWRLKREEIGDYLSLHFNRNGAITRADAVLRERALDPNSFRKAVELVDTTGPITNEFLRRRMSISQINEIYATRVPGVLWLVRYFHDSQPEEFGVTLRPDGTVHAFRHTLAEAAKGANLSKPEAQSIAENFLRDQKQMDLSGWKLVEATSDKRPDRTDHTLTWQQNTPLDPDTKAAASSANNDAANHAYARVELQVLGEEPVNYRTYIKIPEDFVRAQEEQSFPRTLIFIAQVALCITLVLCVLVYYFKRLRVPPLVHVPWRRMLRWGLFGFGAFLLSFFLGKGMQTILMQYKTAIPLRLYLGTVSVGMFIFSALVLGGLALLFGFAWYFAARAFGEEQLPGWLGMPADYYRDAFFIGIGGSALLIGLRHLLAAASLWWPTLHRSLPSNFSDTFDSFSPAAGILGSTILRALLTTGVIALAAAFLGAELRLRWLRLFLFFAIPAAFVSGWGTPADFVKQFLELLIVFAVVVFGIRRIVRFNLLGCFLILACTALLGSALDLVSQPDSFYRANGYAVLTALVALLAWPLVLWRMDNTKPSATVAT